MGALSPAIEVRAGIEEADKRLRYAATYPTLTALFAEFSRTDFNRDEQLHEETDLPTYGGGEPANPEEVFSWDPEYLLVEPDLTLVRRGAFRGADDFGVGEGIGINGYNVRMAARFWKVAWGVLL
jgi:hypothetical protein